MWIFRYSRKLRYSLPLIVLLLMGVLAGCAASRSPISGTFDRAAERNPGADKVSVLFHFRHLGQMHGQDAIPKIKNQGVKDFDNLFRDALSEVSNIAPYATFTDLPSDVYHPERRKELDSLKQSYDYTAEIDFLEESSFAQQCFSGTISLLSLTVIPMPYSWDYTINTKLYDHKGALLRTYSRKATLTNWMEAVLIFAYPFYPLEGKRELIYSESLHDIFRQIETEKILKKQGNGANEVIGKK